MAESPLTQKYDLLTYEILSNGKAIYESVEVISIVINQEGDNATEAIITLKDGLPKIGFQLADSNVFSLDREIEIKLGYNSDNEKLFKGRVTQKKVIVKSDLSSILQISCKHNNYKGEANLKDTIQKTLLELTYGYDILETELNINSVDSKTINGHIKFQGSAKARVNDTIKLKGFGRQFSDNKDNSVIISSVTHKVEEGNWITTLAVGDTH